MLNQVVNSVNGTCLESFSLTLKRFIARFWTTLNPRHLLYLANSYFYNHKPSPRILRQHRVLRSLRKNNIVIKLYSCIVIVIKKRNSIKEMDCNLISKTLQYTIKEIISDTSKFEKLNEDPTLNVFYVSRNKKTFLMKLNMINCILLVLLLLVSMALLKCKNSPLVIYFLNSVRLFHL